MLSKHKSNWSRLRADYALTENLDMSVIRYCELLGSIDVALVKREELVVQLENFYNLDIRAIKDVAEEIKNLTKLIENIKSDWSFATWDEFDDDGCECDGDDCKNKYNDDNTSNTNNVSEETKSQLSLADWEEINFEPNENSSLWKSFVQNFYPQTTTTTLPTFEYKKVYSAKEEVPSTCNVGWLNRKFEVIEDYMTAPNPHLNPSEPESEANPTSLHKEPHQTIVLKEDKDQKQNHVETKDTADQQVPKPAATQDTSNLLQDQSKFIYRPMIRDIYRPCQGPMSEANWKLHITYPAFHMLDDQAIERAVRSRIKTIVRSSVLSTSAHQDVWLRFLGVRPCSMDDAEFQSKSKCLGEKYLLLKDRPQARPGCLRDLCTFVFAYTCLDTDVPRSQLKNDAQKTVLSNIIVAFLTEHKNVCYYQGFNFIGTTCIELFSTPMGDMDPNDEHLIYAIFSSLMQRHMLSAFNHDFKGVKFMAQTTLKLLRKSDGELYNVVKDMKIDEQLLSTYLLWCRLNIRRHPLPKGEPARQQAHNAVYSPCREIISLWSFFLTSHSPSDAVACMVAAMLSTLRSKILGLAEPAPILSLFSDDTQWDWSLLRQQCIFYEAKLLNQK